MMGLVVRHPTYDAAVPDLSKVVAAAIVVVVLYFHGTILLLLLLLSPYLHVVRCIAITGSAAAPPIY